MSVTREQVLAALRHVQDPDLHKDIVTLGFVKDVQISGSEVDFTVELTTPACPVKDVMKAEAERLVAALSEEQRPLLRALENAFSVQSGEETRYYYRAGFGDAIQFLREWHRAQ